jgi:hypothetical protein
MLFFDGVPAPDILAGNAANAALAAAAVAKRVSTFIVISWYLVF